MTDNNQLPQPDNALLQAIQMAFEIPGVKLDRKTFLIAKFNMTTDQVNNGGPQDYFQKEKIDKIAENSINFNVFSSTALSTAAGLPGGFAMAATIPADIAQNMGFSLRLAQELAYIYGYKDIFNSNGDLTEEGQTQLILFLGIMFGVQGAGAVLRVMAQNAAKYVSKKILTSALTKTW